MSVDGRLLIDEWNDHPPKTVIAETSLGAGHHLVVVEFYENLGDATASVSWAPVTAIQNFRGEYFGNKSLSGSPLIVRDDAKIDFGWGAASPAPGVIGADVFSARWTRTISPGAGNYRFSMTVDDGGRLWVNNHLLIDRWLDQAARTYTGDIYLPAGGIPIKMEYYENAGDAVARGVTILEKLVAEFPNVPQYQFDLSEAYAVQDRGPDAADRLEKAAETDERVEPSFVLVIETAGRLLQRFQAAQGATQALRDAMVPSIPRKRSR